MVYCCISLQFVSGAHISKPLAWGKIPTVFPTQALGGSPLTQMASASRWTSAPISLRVSVQLCLCNCVRIWYTDRSPTHTLCVFSLPILVHVLTHNTKATHILCQTKKSRSTVHLSRSCWKQAWRISLNSNKEANQAETGLTSIAFWRIYSP